MKIKTVSGNIIIPSGAIDKLVKICSNVGNLIPAELKEESKFDELGNQLGFYSILDIKLGRRAGCGPKRIDFFYYYLNMRVFEKVL